MEKNSSAKKVKHNPAKQNGRKDFLVVGLGASAGGVRALQEFFAAMPPDSGMAFVVILHLSPEHESSLAEILQAQTEMQVTQVTKTVKVLPNRVYVIPPNQQLELVDGVVRPAAVERPLGQRVTIDVFFRTLAEAYERNAVCIILSGTGSDGTLGLKRVKEKNGFAIVQDPNDAEYDAMPRSAINTQIVDWVLPVSRMPEKLISFRASSERLHLTAGDDREVAKEIQADESLREILTLLRVRTGHDFSNYKTPTLIRRVARHLQIHELEDIPSYLEILRSDSNEVHSLLKNLLINVTNFFRDKEAFEALEAEIIPNLFAGKSARDTVRVWSAGCASGEEAYSLAMLLNEYTDRLADPPKFQIFASDVDNEAVQEARSHRYPESIETDVSAERLKRFFIKEGSFYSIRKELREKVLFAPHNVLRDPPFSRLDLVSCRNLLIYLNRETQEKVLRIFHFALNAHGYLFLGSSESAENAAVLFAPIDKKHRIFSRRAAPLSQVGLPVLPVIGRWDVRLPDKKSEISRDRAATVSEIHYKLLEKYAPSSVLVNQDFDIVYLSGAAGKFLRFTGGEPSRNILKAVNPELLPDLRAALFAARQEQKSSEFPNVRISIDGEELYVNLIVRASGIEDEAGDFLLVIFEETKSERKILKRPVRQTGDKDEAMELLVRRLEEDLQHTKENLRVTIEQHETTVEELKASNEELQAINEELRSASEELETSKEELQSVNEELTTVNHELKDKIEETNRVNSDLQNLVQSTDIGTIFLDRTLRVTRYTPRVTDLFNIIPTDIDRPLEHLTHRLDYDFLTQDASEVLENLRIKEREVRGGSDDSRYLVRLAPYRTLDDKIDGVVMSFQDITDLKRASDALIESEERFSAIVNQTTAGMVETDLNGRIILVNNRFCEMVGYSYDELLETRLHDLIHKKDLPASEKLFKRTTSKGEPFAVENRYIRKNGSSVWIHATVTAITNAGGKPKYVLVVALDIAERKQIEEDLQESEERLRLATEAAQMYSWEYDVQTKKYKFSGNASKILGVPADSLPQTIEDTFALVHPGDKKKIQTSLKEALRDGKDFALDFRSVKASGEIIWLSVQAVVITNIVGKPVNILGIAQDVSARKQAEVSVRKSEEHLQMVLESTKDYSIISFDLKGVITSWNSGAESMFGYTEQEAVGQYGALLFTPEDRAAKVPEKEMRTALEKGRAEDERWHIRKDGSRFYASGVMQPLRDGTVEGFVKIARDQTEKLNAETALREKEMLHRLVVMQEDERRRIARDLHDHFGQQLTALRLKLESLKKICDDDKVCEGIEESDKIAARLDSEIDFLAWELRPAALDDLGLRATLANFVKEWSMHTKVKTGFHTNGIGRTRLSPEVETNLYRIAQEALNNIYKHARATNVSVLLERHKDSIVLIIEDDGVGFKPSEKKKRIAGLGLTSMSERTKICGGTIEVESAPDSGTTIFIRIPVKEKSKR